MISNDRNSSAGMPPSPKIGTECVSEDGKPVGILLCIALDFDGYDGTFFTKDEINLVITIAPIEYLKAMNECLTDNPCSNTRLKDTPP